MTIFWYSYFSAVQKVVLQHSHTQTPFIYLSSMAATIVQLSNYNRISVVCKAENVCDLALSKDVLPGDPWSRGSEENSLHHIISSLFPQVPGNPKFCPPLCNCFPNLGVLYQSSHHTDQVSQKQLHMTSACQSWGPQKAG